MSGKYFPTMYFGGRAVAELIFQSTWHHGFFKIKSDIVVGKWWMNEWMNVGNISAPRKSNECSLKNVRPDWCLQRRCLSYLFTFGFICCMVIVEVWIRKAPISSYIWTIGSSCWCNYLERIWRYDLIGGCMSLWGGKFWGFKSSHDSQYFSPPLSPPSHVWGSDVNCWYGSSALVAQCCSSLHHWCHGLLPLELWALKLNAFFDKLLCHSVLPQW